MSPWRQGGLRHRGAENMAVNRIRSFAGKALPAHAARLPHRVEAQLRRAVVSAPGETGSPAEGPGAAELVSILRDLVEELQPHSKGRVEVDLDSRLDRDLGLDSLTRMELLARLERRWEASLPASAVAEADTPRDLLRILRGAGGEATTIRSEPEAPLRTMPGQVPPSGTTDPGGSPQVACRPASRPRARASAGRYPAGALNSPTAHCTRVPGGSPAGSCDAALAPGESVAIMLPTGFE